MSCSIEVTGKYKDSGYFVNADERQSGWAERVSCHDIVCLSPPLDPINGLPIGNGDIGGLVWCEPDGLVIAVNKCDLWDDSPDRENGGFGKEMPRWEDRYGTLRQACRVRIDTGLPLMDTLYLLEFEARLNLATGTVSIRSRTPFGTFEADVFVSLNHGTVVAEYHISAAEPVSATVSVERWGSRTFAHWYSQIQRDPGIGLAGTEARLQGKTLIIEQQLAGMSFAVSARCSLNGSDLQPGREHSRAGTFAGAACERQDGLFLLTVNNSEEADDTIGRGISMLNTAQADGIDEIRRQHCDDWRLFWLDTHIDVENKFHENIWYLALYYAGSSQRGRYPGLFTQGLWGWNRDFQPWNFYYHWNQQQLLWPLGAAAHPELMRPYLDYRYNTLEKAVAAATAKGGEGAWYTDVCDRLGYCNWEHEYNRTPGAQIAADFWRYYRFSGDEEYLQTKGWPVIREVVRWHISILKKGEDGLYHGTPGWGYEGGCFLRDCTSELSATKHLLEIAAEVSDLLGFNDDETVAWREVLAGLASPVTMTSPVNHGVEIYAAGYQEKDLDLPPGASNYGPTAAAMAAQRTWKDMESVCAHDPKRNAQIFSDVETSVVFPSGNIGIKDKGTKAYDLAVASARECDMYWTGPVVLARLGLAEELAEAIDKKIADTDLNCCGFYVSPLTGRDFWKINMIADPLLAPENYADKDYNGSEWDAFRESRIPWHMWDFRQIGQELTFMLAAAVSESLLQSYDGAVRVAPAVADGSPFAFTLLAEGGFLVTSQGYGKQPEWIHIESRLGGSCSVYNPWSSEVPVYCLSGEAESVLQGDILTFATEKNGRYLLTPRTGEEIPVYHSTCNRQTEPRYFKEGSGNVLGIPRMF